MKLINQNQKYINENLEKIKVSYLLIYLIFFEKVVIFYFNYYNRMSLKFINVMQL